MQPGTPVTLQVWRGDALIDVRVVLGERPWDSLVLESIRPLSARLGMLLADQRRTGAPTVRVVVPESPASVAGVRTDQIVIKVGERAVSSTIEAYGAMIDQGLLLGKPVSLSLREPDAAATDPLKTVRISIDR
jgi:S1-C subfamily serine protease